jgi:FlaA1/EpsC-like NDP-sugar epimerase
MAYRAVFVYCLAFLAWAYVGFTELWINGFNVLVGSFGGAIGLIFGVIVTQRQLKIIEKNSEFKATRKMWAIALLAIIVLLSLLVYFALAYFALYLVVMRQIASFVFLILPPFYATQIGLFLNWERKNRKHILFEGLGSPRVYASPETERT